MTKKEKIQELRDELQTIKQKRKKKPVRSFPSFTEASEYHRPLALRVREIYLEIDKLQKTA